MKKSLVPWEAPAYQVDGLTGATSSSRYVGGTASGAPTSGTFLAGDFVVARNGHIWVCTTGGSPGTWVDAGSFGGGSVTLATTVQTESGLDAGQVGTSTNVAREDHRHPITNLVDFSSTQTVSGIKTFSGDVTFAAGGSGTGAGTMMQRGIQASTLGTTNNIAGLVMSNPNAATSGNTSQIPGVIAFAGNYWTGATSAAWSSTISGYRKTASLNAIQVTTDVFELTGALTVAGLATANGGLVVPAGQALTTGTRSVVTGTRTTTTNASDTVDLGTFSTTGGAIELRVHAHLAAPTSGATASVTKVYEIAAGSLMGTASTWYLCLPADASANAAATNDFALEIQRTAAGTFQLRFRQKSIGVGGAINFTVETLGDTVVVFTPSTTVTAAPAAVSTPHPSNAFVAAAGNIGIGTDAPTWPLTVSGSISVSSGAGLLDLAQGGNRALGFPVSAGGWSTDATGVNDIVLRANSGGTVFFNVNAGTGASAAKVNSTGLFEGTNRVYSAGNPPPYPVTTVAGRAGAVTLTAADIASGTFPGTYTVTGGLAVTGTLSGAGIETLEYGLRAGVAITGGGQLSFDASSNFGWSARFIVIGVGNSASSSTNGYFEMVMPTSGAVAVAGGAGARNWSAAGVVINIWEALWYRLPIGSGNTTVPGNYLITTYTSAMTPPSADYVLLAIRNGDDSLLRTCVGKVMSVGQIVAAGSSVFSVAGRTGSVALTAADIAAGSFPSGSFTFPGTVTHGNIITTAAASNVMTVDAALWTLQLLGSATNGANLGIGRASGADGVIQAKGTANVNMSDLVAGDLGISTFAGTLRLGVVAAGTNVGASTVRVTSTGTTLVGDVAASQMRFAQSRILTSETTVSTTYVALATAQSVSGVIVPSSGAVLITLAAQMSSSVAVAFAMASVQVVDNTTSTTIYAAQDNDCIVVTSAVANAVGTMTRTFPLTGLTAGHSLTVSMMFRSSSGASTATFLRRQLIVQPLI